MTVFVYYTPQIASPINDRRGGTYRVGSNGPDPIRMYKGWDSIMYFALRNHTQTPYSVTGRNVTARMYNTENTEVWSGALIADPLVEGAASVVMSSATTSSFDPGLYGMIIEYEDDRGNTLIASTAQSLPRFTIEILDTTTVNIRN